MRGAEKMESLGATINKVFKGAGRSVSRFPAAIASAIVISIVAMIRISMEWQIQKQYTFLFDSIQISFVLGAVFSMAAVAYQEIKEDKQQLSFIIANLGGVLAGVISFLLLYFLGGTSAQDQTIYLSSIALGRVSVAIFISAVAFVLVISRSRYVTRFSHAFFISHRAFIVSGIYGIVIMLGVSGVVGAFEALVYNNMNFRVYQYLGVGVGFLTYLIFLGYFPGFREDGNQDEIEAIKEQPRFIVVLLDYILVPIMLALTVVLLIWSVRVMLKGVDVSFSGLSGIASSYVIIGIWLHIMVANHKIKIAEFYKKAYPLAGILILLFEAWALFGQISKFGLQTAEYSFLMIWIFATISVVLLIVLKYEAYRKIALIAGVISVIWVLPIVGYQDITFNSQIKRLEKLLIRQELLVNDHIMAKEGEVEHAVKAEITDAVNFIAYSEKRNTPSWFSEGLEEEKTFKETFGFNKTYGSDRGEYDYSSANFRLETDVIDISDYSLSLNINAYEDIGVAKGFEGDKGTYEVTVSNDHRGIPTIIVAFEDNIVIEENMEKYLLALTSQYPAQEYGENNLPLEEMSVTLEGEDLSMLIVFNNINAYINKREDTTDYHVGFQGIYIKDQ